MSENPSEPATGPVVTSTEPVVASEPVRERDIVHRREPNRLGQVAAWVGIVAGIVFIVAVIFGTGFWLGVHAGGGHHGGGHHRGGPPGVVMQHRGPPMFPGMFPGGPGGQGGPFGPGGQGADRAGPPPQPSAAPTPPR